MSFNTKLPDDKVNVTNNSALGDLSWMLGGLFISIVVLYFTLGFIVEYGVKNISIKQEQEIFSYLNITKFTDSNQSKEEKKLQSLVDASSECSKTSYEFFVNTYDSDEQNLTNAFAVPGGLIVLTKTLIDNSESENELFFVLAHEIGHFQNRDHLEGLGRSFAATIIASMIGLSDADDLLQTSLHFSESQFSQSRESEADLYAVDLMNCYYGHVGGSTDFFKHLPKDSSGSLFSTHPGTIKRIEIIEKYIKEKQYEKREIKNYKL